MIVFLTTSISTTSIFHISESAAMDFPPSILLHLNLGCVWTILKHVCGFYNSMRSTIDWKYFIFLFLSLGQNPKYTITIGIPFNPFLFLYFWWGSWGAPEIKPGPHT